jgi:deoxyribose-phosphate aldolase
MKKIKKYSEFIGEELNTNDIQEINSMIDYTLLEDSSTEDEIKVLCRKAIMLGVKSVCVLPKMVKVAAETLKESKVLVCTVVSFPEGTNVTSSKLSETEKVITDGADEVDMVFNYKMLQSNYEDVADELFFDVNSIVEQCHKHINKEGRPIILKVIVESGLLTEEQTKEATKICLRAGADFIKTSTGKVAVGAELNKIKVMYNTIRESGRNMKIKASGGVRDMSQIELFMPYVDRFGMGFGSVDKLNNIADNPMTSSY